jgi:hypothetical protein
VPVWHGGKKRINVTQEIAHLIVVGHIQLMRFGDFFTDELVHAGRRILRGLHTCVSDQNLRSVAEFRHIIGCGRSLPPAPENCIYKGHLYPLQIYFSQTLLLDHCPLHMVFPPFLQDLKLFSDTRLHGQSLY